MSLGSWQSSGVNSKKVCCVCEGKRERATGQNPNVLLIKLEDKNRCRTRVIVIGSDHLCKETFLYHDHY